MPEILDAMLKTMVTLSGIGLIGLTLVRRNARGRWWLVGLDCDELFDPKMTREGEMVSWVFGLGVFLVVLRCLIQVS